MQWRKIRTNSEGGWRVPGFGRQGSLLNKVVREDLIKKGHLRGSEVGGGVSHADAWRRNVSVKRTASAKACGSSHLTNNSVAGEEKNMRSQRMEVM